MKKTAFFIFILAMLFSLTSCQPTVRPVQTYQDETPMSDTQIKTSAANASMRSIYMPCAIDEITELGDYIDSTQYLTQMTGQKTYAVTYSVENTDYSIRVFADDANGVFRKQLIAAELPISDFTEKKASGIKDGRSLYDIEHLFGEGLNVLSYISFDEYGFGGSIFDCYVWQNKNSLIFAALVSDGEAVKCQCFKPGEITLSDEAPYEDEQIMPQLVFSSESRPSVLSALCKNEGFASAYDNFCMINYGSTEADIEKLLGDLTDGEDAEDHFTKIYEQNGFKAEFYFAKEKSKYIPIAGDAGLLYQAKLDYAVQNGEGAKELRQYKADMLFAGMDKYEAESIIGEDGVYAGIWYDEKDKAVYRCCRYDSDISTLYVYYDYSPDGNFSVRKTQLEQKQNYNEYEWEKYVTGEEFIYIGR